MRNTQAYGERPLFWIRTSLKDLLEFPVEVQGGIGLALSTAQFGGKHKTAKPWKGDGPGIFEVVEDHKGNTYRAVYTVRFAKAVYVLHSFQKKSPKGIATSRPDKNLIALRLQDAIADYEVRYGEDQ